jgi:hypothetical protein
LGFQTGSVIFLSKPACCFAKKFRWLFW